MVQGAVIDRPTKTDLAIAIAAAIGVDAPDVSRGASVDSRFIEEIFGWRTGTTTGAPDVYRATEALLEALGLTYDPYWDTSESRGETGGGTVTARAYSRVLAAITRTPRCFLLSVGEVNPQEFRFGEERRAFHDPFVDAGPGSLVVFIAAEDDGGSAAVGSARVTYIASGWNGPWVAEFDEVQPFTTPVAASELDIVGWPSQRPYVEISIDVYLAITAAGRPIGPEEPTAAGDMEATDETDTSRVVVRLLQDFPASEVAPTITVPDELPTDVPQAREADVPTYTTDGDQAVEIHGLLRASSPSPARDRLAEVRAVELVIAAMENAGWRMSRDRQSDRIGYDLEFASAERMLKVEVKGIQGHRIRFNLTPKEFWRAQTDQAWVLIAVTSVLSPLEFSIHFRTRDRVVEATRVVTGYRMELE